MSTKKGIQAIVAGGLHTDIFFEDVRDLVKADRASLATNIRIAGGGKAVNIARMLATLLPPQKVAMLGRTARDPYNLWKPNIQTLQAAGVITKHVKISPFQGIFPGLAIMQVDDKGETASCLCQGIDNDFLPADITAAESLFAKVGQNQGLYITSLEAPFATVKAGIKLAAKHGLKIMIEPGGLTDAQRIKKELLNHQIFLLKPNEHEAAVLSGVSVKNFSSAQKAAQVLLNLGVQNVVITAGTKGAYLFSKNLQKHIPIPKIKPTKKDRDSSGCGDQVLATLAAELIQAKDLMTASQLAVKAGTLQFYKKGIHPITKQELLT